ncbi:anti-sigma factor [Micromonospora sp. NPDC049679]|uniref:anti-sigma factor n=1 Tax=Micromonospora sp. NPDC049679 TaxID=3155920 RepID=UPI0033F6FB97
MTSDIHTLAGAYVLDAVSDIERAAFARHLSACQSCAREVAELTESVGRLADSTWSVPPPRLREDVLNRVRQTRQLGPGRAERDGRPTLPRWRRGTLAAAAAVVLAAGTGAVTFVVQEQRVRDERAAAVTARAESERMKAVLSAPDAVVRSTTVDGGGRVTIVMSPSLDAGVATLSGLAGPGGDRAYQLWLMYDGRPTDAGVMAAAASSATRLISGVRGAELLAVTREPAGGARQPTMPTVARLPMA